MYEAFYGLREKPFNLTPDPKFLYLSDKHKEAFAHLLFGIKNRSGFVMVTGEIGTGKTTICRNLLNQLDDDVEVAFIFNPALNPVELLKKINQEFGVDASPDTALELIDILNAYLLRAAGEGKNCVLVIDEAQNLAPNVLEQIRLLSNLETETEKLLQIILIGQPELGEKLALHELRQLNQRITARYHLKPLDDQEAFQYISYRLHVAGIRRKALFDRAAARLVYKLSGGTPRVINALCDRALLIGYTREAQNISKAIVRQAYREIRGERVIDSRPARTWRDFMPSPSLVGAAVVVLIIAIPLNRIASQWGSFNEIISSGEPAATERQGLSRADARADRPDEAASGLNPAAKRVLQQIAGDTPEPAEAEAPPVSDISAAFAELSPDTTRQAAAAALLRAWNFTLVTAYPKSDDPGDLRTFAEQHRFSFERLEPAIDQLLAINLPAMVRLEIDGERYWSALTTFEDGQRLRITTGTGDAIHVNRDTFRDHYQSEALFFWRDPAPNTPVLREGRTGSEVAALKEDLRALDRLPPSNTNDRYDQATATAVSRLQSETGLIVDGIAGKQVRMVLTSWTAGEEAPALEARAPLSRDRAAQAPAPTPAPAPRPAAPNPEAEAPAQPTPVAEPRPEAPAPAVDTQRAEAAPDSEAPPEAAPPPFLDVLPPAQPFAPEERADGNSLPSWTALREAAAEAQEAAATRQALPPAGAGSWVEVQDLDKPSAGSESREDVTPPATGNSPLVPSGNS